MQKKQSTSDVASEFRTALATDISDAAAILSKHPEVLDYPVFVTDETALHFYAVEGHTEAVSFLLSRGANPNGIAEQHSPFVEAASLGHAEICKQLLASGVDPNSTDIVGETALHKASTNGKIEVIKVLLNGGADPTIDDGCDVTPLDLALPRKKAQIEEVFLDHAKRTKSA